ncbi:MAG: glycogen/starch synthase [Prevotellaceae bacterium]|jgi:starch synthase|nr:glycogen/starch synthase [Prevotellaceae bacterium]
MENTRVLFVCSEIIPYLPKTPISIIGRELPQGIQDLGYEIRTFMPRYGHVNERRNQLHEVIRLSGMNLIINDTDHPLIIKVASISSARMQIYFIDNDDYFQRKNLYRNDDGVFFDDNDERSVFFARGVLETVRKLRWSPNIVHCHGWFSCLIALYLKKSYKDDPLYANTKVILSIYNDGFEESFSDDFKKNVVYDGLKTKDLELLSTPNYVNLMKLCISYADGVIAGSSEINADFKQYIDETDKLFLEYQQSGEYIQAYVDFYEQVLSKKRKKKK